ncbi:MAG: carboxypeptidase regulatory-like domain-containing protein [Vicinamibacterales bacterium]
MRASLIVLPFVLGVVALAVPTDLVAQIPRGPGGAAGQRTPPRAMRPGEEPPRGTAVLRGYVIAADTGAPIRRAQVRVSAPDAQDTRMTITDEQGRFEFTELVGGHYSVTASKGGFVTLQYGQRRPGERGTPVDLPAGQTLEKVAIGLPRGSVIAGRISDEFGEPLTGAQVSVLRFAYVNGARQLRPAGQSDRTDDQGSYRVFGLPPGEYYVTATLRDDRGGPRARLDDDVTASGYAPTFYPGTTSAAGAQRVTVNLGEELPGVNFGLTLVPLARVSGRILGPGGLTPTGPVMAIPDEAMPLGGGSVRTGQSRADGTFEIRGLAPGRYVLQVGRGRRPTDDLVGRTSIVVAGADVDNVTIALTTAAVATGRIESDSTSPPAVRPGQMRLSAVSADPVPAAAFGGGASSPVADDFSFELRGMAGPAYLRVSAPSGWYLDRILLDGRDVTDTPIPFEPGMRVAGLRVVLTQSASAISGAVRDDRGAAVLDATVVVFPDDDALWRPQSRFIRTARPDTSGRFELSGLPPFDSYRIVAVQALEDGQANDPEFLALIRDRAERLSLARGEAKNLELRLR